MLKIFYANKIRFVLEIRKKRGIGQILFYPAYSEPDMWGDTTPSAPLKTTNPYETMQKAFEVLKIALYETNHRVYIISVTDNYKARIRLYTRYLKKLSGFDVQSVGNSMIYIFRR